MNALPAGVLTCEDKSGPTPIYFVFAERCCRAVVVIASDSGALLCVPREGLLRSELEDAEATEFVGTIGPFTEAEVGVAAKRAKRTLSIIIFDLHSSAFGHLVTQVPLDFDRDQVLRFGIHRGAEDLPSADATLTIARNFVQVGGERLESYFSAQEGGDLLGSVPDGSGPDTPGGRPGVEAAADEEPSSTDALLQRLLAQAEVTQRTVTGMKDRLASLDAVEHRLGKLEAGARLPSQGAAPKVTPQMFQPDAGPLGADKMQHLRSLAERGPGKLGDLGARSPLKPTKAQPAFPVGAGTIEEEDPEDLDGVPLDEDQPASGSLLERLLVSQSAILQKLTSAKASQQDPLTVLGAASSLDSEDAPKSTGVRGIAARQLLTEQFRKHPQKVVQIFKERLAVARRKGDVKDLEARDLWFHFQDQVPLGSFKTLTHVAFIASAMYEAMERQELARLRMLVCMLAIFAEQASYDAGSLKMAHLVTGLEDPPFAMTELHKVPSSLHAHGQLSDPRWVATNLAYLRDLEGIAEKSGKYVRPGPAKPPEAGSGEEANPKKKPFKPKKGPKKTPEAADDSAR